MSSGFKFSESSTGSMGKVLKGDLRGKDPPTLTEFGDCRERGFMGKGPCPSVVVVEAAKLLDVGLSFVVDWLIKVRAKTSVTLS